MIEEMPTCPFCDGKVIIEGKKGTVRGGASVSRFYRKNYKCTKCESRSKLCKSPEELKKQWRRAAILKKEE